MQNCKFNTKFDPPDVGLAYMAVSGDSLCISAKDGFLMYKKYDNVWEEERRVAR